MTLVEQWNEKLKALKANRDERFGRTPKDRSIEEGIVAEMEGLFSSMTRAERDSIEKPEPPRYRTSTIAQDQYGRLIGYEDLDELEP